jgi:putative nucleotidyltransferase with HDIG domain
MVTKAKGEEKMERKPKDKDAVKELTAYILKVAGVVAVTALVVTIVSALWFHRANNSYAEAFTGAGLLRSFAYFLTVALLLVCIYLYSHYFVFKSQQRTSVYAMIFASIAVTFVICLIAADYLNIFMLPIGLAAMLLCVLVGRRVALVSVIVLMQIMFLTFFINDAFSAASMQNASVAVFVNSVGACLLIYLQSKSYSRIKIILFGFIGGLSLMPLSAVVLIATGNSTMTILKSLGWNLAANTASIVLYMFLLPVFETLFNAADDFRLDEISNLKNPLLKRLANEASGTFNHSQTVAILAENCAIAIGENPHLARAAAYYHDIGKLKNPLYFVENQDNYNPHDELIPEVSVSMITAHATFGAELIRQYHLPDKLAKICREHHGDMPVNFFYQKAKKITEEDLPIENYSYAGPKPSTKISAIIMLADSIEAATRANVPPNNTELMKCIDEIVNERIEKKQFDNCPITFGELAVIKKTIADSLPSVHHARIRYPS